MRFVLTVADAGVYPQQVRSNPSDCMLFSNRYLNRSKLAPTRLYDNHIIMLLPHRLGVLAMLLGSGDIHVVPVPQPAALSASLAASDPYLGHVVCLSSSPDDTQYEA